jgi:Zn-dependent peptidase ImmA (M78 family)
MARAINKIRAEGAAWKITQDYCLDTPSPVPVEDIAMDCGVVCLVGELTGCVARLVRKGRRGVIRTSAAIREEGRKRFAIAHELGHWFLHEDESQFFICTAENMREYKGSPMEVEANLFASELLMPTFLFRPLAQGTEPQLDNIKKLAGQFNTSLTATGMKFVDLNEHECILVLSTNGVVTWSKQKGTRTGLRIEKGTPLHTESLARYAFNSSGKAGPEIVPTEAWVTGNWYDRQIEITEESWAMEDYDSVLSLLTVVDSDDGGERDMVDHYHERNTPLPPS